MNWIAFLGIVSGASAIGAFSGVKIGTRITLRRAQREAAQDAARVNRELHDAHRTTLPREGVNPVKIRKASFKGRY
jgi:hypothetical protein